jgi:hypothetical protein
MGFLSRGPRDEGEWDEPVAARGDAEPNGYDSRQRNEALRASDVSEPEGFDHPGTAAGRNTSCDGGANSMKSKYRS